ncbi:MAG: HAMP domain-containing histidine kinase [Chromatiales bacterium]|nr:HAMP domain-containing histidine kinase [Chromatiales bacterium]
MASLRIRQFVIPPVKSAWQTFVVASQYFRPKIFTIGLVGVIAFPLYYVIWAYWFPQPYENLSLRLVGALILAVLMVESRWPAKLRTYYGVYVYLTCIYCFPFFFTYMLMRNEFSTTWGMSTAIAIFLLNILVDWKNLIFIWVTGVCLAVVAYYLTSDTPIELRALLAQLPIYLFAVGFGSLLSYTSEMVTQEKLRATLAAGANIAHELRTPLLSIRSGAIGVKRYFPQLLDGYQKASAAGLEVAAINPMHLRRLESLPDEIEKEVEYSQLVIDILLMNAGNKSINPADFSRCSVRSCVDLALSRYPYTSDEEAALVHNDVEGDFEFIGSEILMNHVLFNLLRNAIHYVRVAGKGQITVWGQARGKGYCLYFRDTGTGIPADALPHIFERFFTTRQKGAGTGLGLAFCKMAMESFEGSIDCDARVGQYTQFRLCFPPPEEFGYPRSHVQG